MNQNRPPYIDIEFGQLPQDPRERHEVLLDVLGQYMVSLRNWSVDSSRKVVSTPEAKEKLGNIRWKRYEGVASMPPEQQQAACQLAEATVDRFIQLLLTMLSGTGVDQRLGSSHAARFKLDMEILDVQSEEIVGSETLNRGGQKFFADYWGRWMNRFSSTKSNDNQSIHAAE